MIELLNTCSSTEIGWPLAVAIVGTALASALIFIAFIWWG